jgi:hypothetical protein
MVWEFVGGTNYWEEEQYNEVPQVISKRKGTNLISIQEVERPAQTRSKYEIKCNFPSHNLEFVGEDFKVTLTLKNKESRSLMRPQENQIEILVGCQSPKSLELHWSKFPYRASSNSNLPRLSSEKEQIRTYYVRTNQRFSVRTLLLDQHNRAFYNFSSVALSKYSTEAPLSDVHWVYGHYSDNVRKDTYARRATVFHNETGEMYLESHALNYHINFTANYQTQIRHVSDKMKIHVVRNVDIEPKFKSLYMNRTNTFEFEILYGSGKFALKLNDTSIATAQLHQRKVKITPNQEGPLKLTIIDEETENSYPAEAELFVSDIHRLEIYGEELIEEGMSTDLTVFAFDTLMNPFSLDQYQFMRVKIDYERVGARHHEGFEIVKNYDDFQRFLGIGHQAATYRVHAMVPKLGASKEAKNHQIKMNVFSNELKIEVFPIVSIYPPNLLLIPGGRWTVQIKGGPDRSGSRVTNNFKIEDDFIAEIDSNGEVRGRHVGKTYLHVELLHSVAKKQNSIGGHAPAESEERVK